MPTTRSHRRLVVLPSKLGRLTWEVQVAIQTAALTSVLSITVLTIASHIFFASEGGTPGARVAAVGRCAARVPPTNAAPRAYH